MQEGEEGYLSTSNCGFILTLNKVSYFLED